jgi:hypothetical protein
MIFSIHNLYVFFLFPHIMYAMPLIPSDLITTVQESLT